MVLIIYYIYVYKMYTIFQIMQQLSLDIWSRKYKGQVSLEVKVGAEKRDNANYLDDSGNAFMQQLSRKW